MSLRFFLYIYEKYLAYLHDIFPEITLLKHVKKGDRGGIWKERKVATTYYMQICGMHIR